MIIAKYQNKAWELLLKAIDCSNKYHQENCVIVATDWLLNLDYFYMYVSQHSKSFKIDTYK